MNLSFADDKLKKLCENSREAQKALGAPSAKKLRRRLTELEASASVYELPAGRPHPLTGDRDGHFAVDLHGGHRLEFEPAHEEIPLKDDGGIDWARVRKIRIVYIGDYHD